jgi:hypothetical protein
MTVSYYQRRVAKNSESPAVPDVPHLVLGRRVFRPVHICGGRSLLPTIVAVVMAVVVMAVMVMAVMVMAVLVMAVVVMALAADRA